MIVNYSIKNYIRFAQVKNIAGAGLSVTNVQPAMCNNAIAGYIGPFFRSSSSKATPRYSPSSENEIVPLFISRSTPKHPDLLNVFPY